MDRPFRHLGWRRLAPGSESGLSLVELLVTLVCVSLIVMAVFAAFGSQIWTESREEKVMDMQLNARVAMERLTWLFRHAGFGCADAFKDGKTMTDGVLTVTQVLTPTNNTSNGTTLNPDQVIAVVGFKQVAEVNGDFDKTASVTLKNVTTPTITTAGFTSYITFAPYPNNYFYQVTDASNPYVLSSQVDQVIDDAAVYMVAPIIVRVDANATLVFENKAYDNVAASLRPQYWEVAQGIEDLQFQYSTDHGLTWVNDTASPADIDGVRIFLLARSPDEDRKYTDDGTYTLAGQAVGPFNDHYHRLLMESTIMIRN